MKVLITGGHLTPALAVLQKLPQDMQAIYVGRKNALEGDRALSLEYQVMTKKQIPFIEFNPGRLQRSWSAHTFTSLSRMPSGVIQAVQILKKQKPDVILSFGGYVALPVALASVIFRIPLVTHEQTFGAGATNKIIAAFATYICISWKQSEKYFPAKKIVLTGNPLVADYPSRDIKQVIDSLPNKLPLIVITGGSLGSHVINRAIEAILPQLLKTYTIFHQTGDAQEFKDYDRLENFRLTLSRELQERYTTVKFINPEDITYVYKKANLVISRSGANTIQLLLLLNKPSLLIPLASGQKNEQKTNADFLVSCGLGEEISQDSLNSQQFIEKIYHMMENLKNYTNPKQNEQWALHKKAAERIIECIYAAYRKNKT